MATGDLWEENYHFLYSSDWLKMKKQEMTVLLCTFKNITETSICYFSLYIIHI